MKRWIARTIMALFWFVHLPIAFVALIFITLTKELGYAMEKVWFRLEKWMDD